MNGERDSGFEGGDDGSAEGGSVDAVDAVDAARPRPPRSLEAQVALQIGALNAAANAIVITDAGGRIEWVNAAFRTCTGYSDDEALGRTPGELLRSGEHDAAFYAAMWDTIRAGGVWSGEMVNRRKDGTRYHEEMTITPMRDAGGEITHFVAVKQDITERKRLEEQVLRAQRMESIGVLAGGIAHDLNNVLAPILMSVDLLRMGEADPERLESIATIETSAERGASLVRQVLAFARGVDEPTGAVDLRVVAEDVAMFVRDTLPKEIRFTLTTVPDLWPVRANATQIHQVLMNLCVNARDAMPGGGALEMRVSNVRFDAMHVEMLPGAEAGPYVVIEVEDSGVGISAADRARIYDPFFTTKGVGQGTGLGLATVDTIVRGHRGFIDLSSEPGRGTTFAVYLPALPDEVADAEPAVVASPPRGRGELVLVVDDEEPIRDATRATLERHGYEVAVAIHGADAVRVFAQRAGEVAVVVMDMAMPIMDGRAATVALRSLDPDVRVLGTSGHTSSADVTRALHAGVARFIAKPFSAETLLRALDEVLRPVG